MTIRDLYIKIEKKIWEVKVSQIGFQNYKKIFGIPIWEIKKRDTFNKEKLINEILSVKENNESPPREYDNDPNRGFHNQGYETPPGLGLDSYKDTGEYVRDVLEGENGLNFPHQIVAGWGNINKKYQANMPHTHGGVGLAAVLFLNNSKGLTLYYPSPLSGINNISDAVGMWNDLEQYHVDVEEGDIVVFPSNLLHWVRPHNKDKDRVTFAVNISIN